MGWESEPAALAPGALALIPEVTEGVGVGVGEREFFLGKVATERPIDDGEP